MKKQVWLSVVAITLALTGCGGGDSTSSAPVLIPTTTAPVAPPTPPPTAAAPQTTFVNIQTYERSATVAYPTSVTSAIASLTQETISVETPKSAGEYSQLSVTKLGFQTSWYPYTAQDSTPIQIGLYKADTVPRQHQWHRFDVVI